jgi:protein-S-isoprenylcysteine O-methyltransferase Ste14
MLGWIIEYLTWTMLMLAVMMLGLIYRAHREEYALAIEFGGSWEDYKHQVPMWIPRFSKTIR